MRLLLVMTITAFLFSTPSFAAKTSKWQLCGSASDCTIVKTFCNCPTSINKKYKSAFAKYVAKKEQENVVECPKKCDFDKEMVEKLATCDERTRSCQVLDSAPKRKK